jgi:transcriptional regulator with XRE-family HTH domain
MSSLAKTVKSIRKRLGKTQSEFATTLKVQPPTISRYESGKIVPSLFVLVQLHDLANTDEKRVFEEALGFLGDAVKRGSIRPISGPDFAGFTFGGRRVIANAHLTDAQQKAIHEAKQPLDEIEALWAQYSADKRAVEFFREAATYLRVRLSGLK